MDSKHLQANTDFILKNYQELKDISQLKNQVFIQLEADNYMCFTFNTISSTDLDHLKSEVENKLKLLEELDTLLRQ